MGYQWVFLILCCLWLRLSHGVRNRKHMQGKIYVHTSHASLCDGHSARLCWKAGPRTDLRVPSLRTQVSRRCSSPGLAGYNNLPDTPTQTSLDALHQLDGVIRHLRGTQSGPEVKGDLPQKFLNYHQFYLNICLRPYPCR